ncbi:LLM class F420-dependent oxidoreductase [Halioglobus japonicus]|uniref:TIGR03617 family F420-dependent LLM class oxidoreductase n=1 Tax=Halioglobus japonicus TaxID=930805 RepID=A0AAP8MGG5_9GAMM|nr:TIGR03617 family F420-dependent LLM class oxidoreductase [Halioglobus japonicus]PLW87373.1 TIGR03617 family F420-dependent LLM class oxidoreductase [Halioglobus japonicus]GHD08813.1 LLM class F420-dependent oxidoreductase [Halioglobus japonicus]
MFQVFATTPENMGPGEIGAHAARAEAMGFDGLHVPDAVHDGLLLSAMALAATETLLVGTGVLLAFPRSPMITAIAAWDLQKMSGGRFELGLGTQIKQNIEQRYSARWDSPVPQLREYVQALRAIFHSFQTGDRLNFEGDHYQLTRLQPFFNPGPIDHPNIPILCGAVGPAMTRMVGRIADGMITHPTNTPPEYIRDVCLPRLQGGFEQAGNTGDDFKLVLGPLTATGKDEATVAAQWEKQRNLLGFLYSTPAYWPSLELFGWEAKGQQLLDMTRAGNWQAMPDIVTDEMLAAFVPRGTYSEIVDTYKNRYANLTRRITFPMPDNPADDGLAAKAISALQRC